MIKVLKPFSKGGVKYKKNQIVKFGDYDNVRLVSTGFAKWHKEDKKRKLDLEEK